MALDPNHWTAKTQEALSAAAALAGGRNNPEVTPEHLLAAMLGQEGTVTLPVLERVGISPLAIRNRTEDALAKLPRSYGGGAEPQLGRAALGIFNRADQERQNLGDEYLSVEHLLLAMADQIAKGADRFALGVVQVGRYRHLDGHEQVAGAG